MTNQTTEIKLAKQYKKVIIITDTVLIFLQWLLIAVAVINKLIPGNLAIVFIALGTLLILLVIIKHTKKNTLSNGVIDKVFLIWTAPLGLISIIPFKIYQNELIRLNKIAELNQQRG